MVSRPPDPPPTPPTELPPSRPPATTGHLLFSNPPLETSLDDDSTALNAVTRGRRSRSVGQMLETNFDEEGSEPGGPQQTQQPPHESTPLKNNGHSRSLGESGLFKLSVGDELLESDLWEEVKNAESLITEKNIEIFGPLETSWLPGPGYMHCL